MKLHIYALFVCFSLQQVLHAAHMGKPMSYEDYKAMGIPFDVIAYTNANQKMMQAIKDRDIKALQSLFQEAVIPDPNFQDFTNKGTGMTPLVKAIPGGREKATTEIMKFLLDMGANPDLKYSDYTPLQLAIMNNREDAVKLLVKYGADLTIKDKNGNTAIELAQKFGLKDLADLLESYKRIQTPEHKKALQSAAQKVISGTGPLQAQQTAGKTIQEFLL